MHQQEELVGAMLLRSFRINGSSLSDAKDLIQSPYILYQHISSFCVLKIYHIVFSLVGR